ncbi:MAG TPA: DUF456 family protein [Armatimonadota bacterium]
MAWWAEVLTWLGSALYVATLGIGVVAAFLGLPGLPLVLAAGLIFSAAHGWTQPVWWLLLALFPVALAGELADNLFSMAGVRRLGGTSRTMWWAAAGGLLGALALGWLSGVTGVVGLVGGPVGFLIGALLPPLAGGLLGGFLGGYLYERRSGNSPETARRAGWGALLGRLAGGAVKGGCALLIAVLLLIYSW